MPSLISAFALVFLLSSIAPLQAQDLGSSIVGTWKMKSHMHREVASSATSNAYGQQQLDKAIAGLVLERNGIYRL